MMIHEFSNKDVTAEHVILAQAILAGTAQGDKNKAQRFMSFVNDIPDAPTVKSLIPRVSQFMKRFKVS
ncbi:pyrophosphatase [Vibrio sp. ZSDE26]|uniref:Pyrophosphatase n=1 Tax=Vibrio amylolyticus TaxID=2847292 RepID=A0A9X1XNM0_9VIBR|nr:pyrophosphatase [Vibrio amylolyticus]MCK6265770.1 pyrophosphatase [Vibrio amylolyticus]